MGWSRRERIFRRIYRENAWGGSESRSGPGSSEERTRGLRPRLTQLVRELGVRSLLDIPCGDFHWMRLTELPGVEYIGADLLRELVEGLAAHARAGRRFLRLDLLRDPLPKVDLVLCRDALVHFSFADSARALRRLRQSGSTYLLTTTFPAQAGNRDIVTGDWRPLNLALPPFRFPAALQLLPDPPGAGSAYADKSLGLYRLADLPRLDGK